MQLLDSVINLVQNEEVFDSVIEMILVVVSNRSVKLQKATYFPKFLLLLTDGIIGLKFEEAFRNYRDRLPLLIHLYVEFGEQFTDSLVLSVGGNLTDKFLSTMLRVSGINGAFPVEEDVSDTTLYFWFLIEETIMELDLVGKGLNPHIGEIYSQLVSILIKKSTFPHDWSEWAFESRERFIHFRRDIGDTLGYCFEVINERVLVILLEYLNGSLETNISLLEASLFGIQSISEYLSDIHYEMLTPIFELVLPRVEMLDLPLLKSTTLQFISEISDVLNAADSRHLDQSLKFIFNCISTESLSKTALSGLEKVCNSCQNTLISPEFSWVFHGLIKCSSIVQVFLI